MQAVQQILKRCAATTAIGLDVGSSALRAAQLRRQGDRWQITGLAACRRAGGSAHTDDDAAFRARAAHWLQRLPLRGRRVIAGLSQPDIELHAMELPRASGGADPEAQQQAARWEIERLMSLEDGAAETAHWSLPESRQMRTTAMGVAAARTRLDDVLRLCREAGVDCSQVDAAPCALARFGVLYRALTPADRDVWGVLDLGARMSRLVICLDDAPVLARAFEYGGVAWTEKLADSLSVSPETAERHKRDHGIAYVGRSGAARTQAANALGEMIFNVLRMDLDGIIVEVERSYRYVLQCFPGRSAGPLILTGGGGAMLNLDALLRERLGIQVFAPDPAGEGGTGFLACDRIAGQLRESLGSFACAIGLAAGKE